MLFRRLTFSSFAILAGVALSFAACGESANSPGTGGSGTMPSAGATSGGGNAVGGGGSTGSSGSSASGGGTAGAAMGSAGSANAGSANAGSANAGSPNAGSGGVAGASGGVGGSGGNGGAAGGSAAGSAGASGAATFQPCPASGSCKIMPFGDSITQGYNVAGGYRAPLFHLAHAANHDITFVGSASDYSVPTVDGVTFPKNHEGHGGYTIEGNNGIAPFVSTSIPSFKPNIITLMIGTNDINGNNNVADAPNRLGKLLDSIFMRDANILVVLAQINPTGSDGTNNAVKTYNAAMPNLVSTRTSKGQHIVLVDMYTAITKNANYKTALLGDNLHPNQAGYNLMADVWFAALSPYLH
ncbi:MAG: SGNH/GDSL hydrolase family protein [Polyangiaceae bacterium]